PTQHDRLPFAQRISPRTPEPSSRLRSGPPSRAFPPSGACCCSHHQPQPELRSTTRPDSHVGWLKKVSPVTLPSTVDRRNRLMNFLTPRSRKTQRFGVF